MGAFLCAVISCWPSIDGLSAKSLTDTDYYPECRLVGIDSPWPVFGSFRCKLKQENKTVSLQGFTSTLCQPAPCRIRIQTQQNKRTINLPKIAGNSARLAHNQLVGHRGEARPLVNAPLSPLHTPKSAHKPTNDAKNSNMVSPRAKSLLDRFRV